MSEIAGRHPGLLSRAGTVLMMIDVQERLVPAIADHAAVVGNCRKLAQACGRLGVPMLLTEQYPKGLGRTVPELAECLAAAAKMEKVSFSCCGEPAVLTALRELGKRTVLTAGIEAHVCVSQTVHDLLAAGFAVHVPADAVGSRRMGDRDVALERLRAAGAVITTTEAALFELLERADAPEFKDVHKLLK